MKMMFWPGTKWQRPEVAYKTNPTSTYWAVTGLGGYERKSQLTDAEIAGEVLGGPWVPLVVAADTFPQNVIDALTAVIAGLSDSVKEPPPPYST